MHKRKIIAASLWSLLDVLGRQGTTFLVTIFLARLLTPNDFGAVTLVTVITGLSGIFVDGGFSYALIQRQNTTREEESSVFWFNMLLATAVFVVLLLVSPILAAYLVLPILKELAIPFGFVVLLSAASSVHTALLTRRLAFRTLTQVSVVSAILSGILAVWMAYRGLGVWALAGQAIAAAAFSTVGLWLGARWLPVLAFRWNALAQLFSYGSFMVLAVALDKAMYGVQSVLIGKEHSVAEVGYYGKAESTLNFPLSVVNALVTRVLFPLFASLAEDRERMLRGLRQAMRLAMLVNAPMMIGLMVTSDIVVRLLLGEQWGASAPILSVLCLVGLLWPIQAINLNVLSGLGRSDLYFSVEVIKKALTIPALILVSPFGVIWMAWTQVALVACACAITIYFSSKLTGYRICTQIADFGPPILGGGVMGFALWAATPVLPSDPLLKFLMMVFAGAILYGGWGLAVRSKALGDARSLIRR